MLMALDALEGHLREDYGVGAILGPATAVKMAHRGYMGDREDQYKVPQSTGTLGRILGVMERSGRGPPWWRKTGNGCASWARWKRGVQALALRDDALDAWCEENMPRHRMARHRHGPLGGREQRLPGLGHGGRPGPGRGGPVGRVALPQRGHGVDLLGDQRVAAGHDGAIMVMLGLDLKVTSGIIYTVAFGIAVATRSTSSASSFNWRKANRWRGRSSVASCLRERPSS